ncbi:MAG: radical SAM protein [Ignisphaera sp.]
MRFKIIEVEVKQALSKSGLPDIDYALNPYIGCVHGCLYCYAKAYTRSRDIVDNWGSAVIVKKNLVDILRRDVKKVNKGVVGIGTITDPYQPVEAIYKLTRKCIELLVENNFKISIQTKSSLILRDLDLLKMYRKLVDVGITITSTSNSSAITKLEPYSSPPQARIETLKKLAEEGIKTWVFYGPIIPGFNDDVEEVAKVLRIAKSTNSSVYIDKFRIKKFMWSNILLKDIAKRSNAYDWCGLFESIFKLCKLIGVKCRYGFNYPGENQNMKLDRYIEKGQNI